MKCENPFDWNSVDDKNAWLTPCEESYYYLNKWKSEGRKSVLDLGCGLGRHALLFAKGGFKTTAVDISDEALGTLKGLCREQNVDILCKKADMEALPFADNAFDCIFAMHSAGHTDTAGMKALMSELARVLKPGGAVFMTLCSKETYTYINEAGERIDENTLLKNEGVERGVPHYFCNAEDIKELFADWTLVKVRHIDDCFDGKGWHLQKHWFIEARINKEYKAPDYSGILGKTLSCKIDRPLGTTHQRVKSLVYPVNYGYVEGIMAGDGAEQDVYVLGVDTPLESFTGRVIAVYHRLNDNEDKWILAPEGVSFTGEEILEKIEFQERFFDGELYDKA